MSKKLIKSTLFDLHFYLSEKGQIEIEMSSVDPDMFREAMESGFPEYDGTHKIASLLRYLNSIGNEIRETSKRYF
jgi:hypothetical protein